MLPDGEMSGNAPIAQINADFQPRQRFGWLTSQLPKVTNRRAETRYLFTKITVWCGLTQGS
jgi:hypothetical protein